MNAWSNLSVSSLDPEIIRINTLEAGLGELPGTVYKIRELITRFEVCHFKYKQHIQKIKDSILHLEPVIVPEKIGKSHIQHGENAWKNDTTGKSLAGQQYVWAVKDWLNNIHEIEIPDRYDRQHGKKVKEWLGNKDADKTRLVRLLLARMTWDWKSYEELQFGGEYKALEFQICRIDLCHYAFPTNLDRLLQGIGEMKPIGNFEGCGSFNKKIRKYIEQELQTLDDLFKSFCFNNKSDRICQIKAWLIACMIKTLKEQVELSEPLIELKN